MDAMREAFDALERIGKADNASIVIRLNKDNAESYIAAPKVAWEQCIEIERFPIAREAR